MIRCSTKRRWPSSALWLLLLLASVATAEPPSEDGDSREEAGAVQKYEIRFQDQLGYHLLDQRDLAIDRHLLRAEYSIKPSVDSHWTAVAGLRAYVEGAFATNPGHFGGQVAQQETEELVPRSLYLQYENGPWLFRVGNQQVVWGEAFGFYYADIVNPKDLRLFGLGDLEDFRVPTPIVNAKWIGANTSLQLLFIPKPFFNKMPAQGSDFAIPLTTYVPGASFTINDSRTAPLATDTMEYGARATALISGIDTSLFFLSYQDRMPVYVATVQGLFPPSIRLDASHRRIWTVGGTATADLGIVVLRAEAFYNHQRSFNTYSTGRLSPSSLAIDTSDELVGVLGIDYTQLGSWQLGFQVSEDSLTHPIANIVFNRTGPFLNAHVHGTPWKQHSLDLIFGVYPGDGSTVTEVEYGIPISDQLEFDGGIILLDGSPMSHLGPFRRGSRAYIQLRGFFNG